MEICWVLGRTWWQKSAISWGVALDLAKWNGQFLTSNKGVKLFLIWPFYMGAILQTLKPAMGFRTRMVSTTPWWCKPSSVVWVSTWLRFKMAWNAPKNIWILFGFHRDNVLNIFGYVLNILRYTLRWCQNSYWTWPSRTTWFSLLEKWWIFPVRHVNVYQRVIHVLAGWQVKGSSQDIPRISEWDESTPPKESTNKSEMKG